MKTLILTLAVLAMASVAQASDFYAKVGGGHSQAHNDESLFYNVGLGVNLTKNIALEGGHIEFGDTQKNYLAKDKDTGGTNIVNKDYATKGQFVGAALTSNVDSKINARLVGGVLFYENGLIVDVTKINGGASTRTVETLKYNSNGLYGGFGLAYQTSEKVKTTFDCVLYDVGLTTISTISIGLLYNF